MVATLLLVRGAASQIISTAEAHTSRKGCCPRTHEYVHAPGRSRVIDGPGDLVWRAYPANRSPNPGCSGSSHPSGRGYTSVARQANENAATHGHACSYAHPESSANSNPRAYFDRDSHSADCNARGDAHTLTSANGDAHTHDNTDHPAHTYPHLDTPACGHAHTCANGDSDDSAHSNRHLSAYSYAHPHLDSHSGSSLTYRPQYSADADSNANRLDTHSHTTTPYANAGAFWAGPWEIRGLHGRRPRPDL